MFQGFFAMTAKDQFSDIVEPHELFPAGMMRNSEYQTALHRQQEQACISMVRIFPLPGSVSSARYRIREAVCRAIHSPGASP